MAGKPSPWDMAEARVIFHPRKPLGTQNRLAEFIPLAIPFPYADPG